MTRLVLTAVSARWDPALAACLGLVRELRVVRRCADLPELLASAAAGLGDLAVVSADLRGLDRQAVSDLAVLGVGVVGLADTVSEDDERVLAGVGVAHVLSTAAGPEEWSALVSGLAAPWEEEAGERLSRATPPTVPPDGVEEGEREAIPPPSAQVPGGEGEGATEEGRLVAVWGPTGAPGRTTVALALAHEIARAGRSVLLVDADTWGASIGQALGLIDEASGLAAAVRAADAGRLDVPVLAGLAPEVAPGLRVLTGVPRPDRWLELREAPFVETLARCRRLAEVVVVDVGFCLEDDEDLSYDTLAPRRNVTTLATLGHADALVAVGGADPVGLQRLVRTLPEVRDLTEAGASVRVVANRVRPSVTGGEAQTRVREALRRFASVENPVLVPDDPSACDAALLQGQPLVVVAPRSPARRALARLADDLRRELCPGPGGDPVSPRTSGERARHGRRRALLRRW